MKKLLFKIVEIFLPLYIFLSSNKKINDRIKSIDEGKYEDNLLYIDDYQKYDLEEILPFYNKTLEKKKTLEDKAKISAVGITISTSIIVGLTGLLLNLNIDINQLNVINIILIILCMLVIIHINISGILALLVIGNKNRVYQLFPEDSKLNDKEKANRLAIYTEQNVNLNIIRHNYVYSSFRHLIYSIILLSLIFISVTFNFNNNDHAKVDLFKLSKDISFLVNQDSSYKEDLESRINALNDSLANYKEMVNKINELFNDFQQEK